MENQQKPPRISIIWIVISNDSNSGAMLSEISFPEYDQARDWIARQEALDLDCNRYKKYSVRCCPFKA